MCEDNEWDEQNGKKKTSHWTRQPRHKDLNEINTCNKKKENKRDPNGEKRGGK